MPRRPTSSEKLTAPSSLPKRRLSQTRLRYSPMSMHERIGTVRDAINEALCEEMERDPSVILLGEDVGLAGGVFKVTKGLFEMFGAERVIDTPISEAGITG